MFCNHFRMKLLVRLRVEKPGWCLFASVSPPWDMGILCGGYCEIPSSQLQTPCLLGSPLHPEHLLSAWHNIAAQWIMWKALVAFRSRENSYIFEPVAELKWSLKKVLVFVEMCAEKSQFFNMLSFICASHSQFNIWVAFLMTASPSRGKAFEVTELVALAHK